MDCSIRNLIIKGEIMISVDEALKIVLRKGKKLPPKKVKLENAAGLCLAEGIKSDLNMPPFNRSAMDGYAVIAKDIKPPIALDVIESIRAGYNPKKKVGRGQASKIMTGAVVPAGADAVVKVEETKALDNDKKVRILKKIGKGVNIARKGEDVRVGNTVLSKGTRIRAQETGILAAVGKSNVKVHATPSVGIISTGDELVEITRKPKPWQIRNSNSKKDILILSGGVSMGEYDLVGNVLLDLGVKIFFEKVALRPGKPTVFGMKGDKLIFALPGNPVSTFVTFELFVKPCIKKMMGYTSYDHPIIHAELEKVIKIKKKRREYRPALLKQEGSGWKVSLIDWHGSGDLFSLTKANGLLIISESVEKLNAGDMVEVMLTDSLL